MEPVLAAVVVLRRLALRVGGVGGLSCAARRRRRLPVLLLFREGSAYACEFGETSYEIRPTRDDNGRLN